MYECAYVQELWFTREEVKGQLYEWILSLYHEDSGDQTQIIRFDGVLPSVGLRGRCFCQTESVFGIRIKDDIYRAVCGRSVS